MQEYPKALYLRGWSDLDAYVSVANAAEERERRAEGYRHIYEFPLPDAALEAAQEDGAEDVGEAVEPAPRRRGRPPKERVE